MRPAPEDVIPVLRDAALQARREADRAEVVAEELADLAIRGALDRNRIDRAWVTVGRTRLAGELAYVAYLYLARTWCRWAWSSLRRL